MVMKHLELEELPPPILGIDLTHSKLFVQWISCHLISVFKVFFQLHLQRILSFVIVKNYPI